MIKRIITALVITFCLAAGVMASPVEQTIFANQAKSGAEFKAALKKYRVVEDGQEYLVVEDDQVYLKRLGIMVHGWAKEKGFLSEEAATDYKVFAAALVERYGEKVAIDQFTDMAAAAKLVIPAKVAPATQPKQPAVAAASAPTPAPVAVAQVPMTTAKPEVALPSNVVTEDKLNAAIKQHQEATVLSTDSLAKTFFGVAKRGAKTDEEIKKSVKALSNGNKEVEQKMLTLLAGEANLRKTQLEAVNGHIGRTDGRVSVLDNKLFWAMVTLAVFAIGLIGLWFRTSAVKKAAIKAAHEGSQATLTAAQAAIEAAASKNAEAVAKVNADIGSLRTVVGNKAERKELVKLEERVEVAEGVLYKDPEWELTEEQRKELFYLVFNLETNETAEWELVLNEGTVLIKFVDHGEDLVSIDDVDVRPFHKKKVCVTLTKLYHGGKLPQPFTLTPVVKLAA